MSSSSDTIVAQATPPGKGGISIVRVSGREVRTVIAKRVKREISARNATFSKFFDPKNQVIDECLVLFFPAPHSFTGEDVLEIHCHGSPIVVGMIIHSIVELGIRLARPGEFSERAFLNEKLDLVQAEAIADLINSATEKAACAAMQSLQGEFSKKIDQVLGALISLRSYVEAAIDFPDEEIDFLKTGEIEQKLETLKKQIEAIKGTAKQGVLIQEGATIVISGEPNVGKSSLLNKLSERDSAIVTDVPGTTRDVMREHIQIDGIPLHIIDTAGVRKSEDKIEQEGIRRAAEAIGQADHILIVIDGSHIIPSDPIKNFLDQWDKEHITENFQKQKITLIKNKIDLISEAPQKKQCGDVTIISLSAKNGEGIDLLKDHLKESLGISGESQETILSARNRHYFALKKVEKFLCSALAQFKNEKFACELIAQDLSDAQVCLSEITGKFSSEDLLGKIFSSFCIGK